MDELEARVGELGAARAVVVFSTSGERSALAAELLGERAMTNVLALSFIPDLEAP